MFVNKILDENKILSWASNSKDEKDEKILYYLNLVLFLYVKLLKL